MLWVEPLKKIIMMFAVTWKMNSIWTRVEVGNLSAIALKDKEELRMTSRFFFLFCFSFGLGNWLDTGMSRAQESPGKKPINI